jgi:hypothetical protein
MQTKAEGTAFTHSVLNQWAKRIDELEERARAKRSGEVGHFKELDMLKNKVQQAHLRFDELKKSELDWQDLAREIDQSLSELEADYKKADSAVR